MTARLLDGARVAEAIRSEVAAEVADLESRARIRPGLRVILVGEHLASAVYVRNKSRAAVKTGIDSSVVRLSAEATTQEVIDAVLKLNQDAAVHGILVQLPLPDPVDSEPVLQSIDPGKDVDGFHPWNVGRLVQGHSTFVPCTPAGIMELLRRNDIPLEGRRAVVLGRSNIVGKPMAVLLTAAHATVTVCHSRTRDLPGVAREADLLVAAIGRPGLITEEFVRPGAVVVDVGMHRIESAEQARDLFGDGSERLAAFERVGNTLVGDVHPRRVQEVAGWLTPVPGGVGPLTVAQLLRNTAQAARLAAGL